MRRSIGTSSMCAFDRHDVGIARHRKHRFAVDDAESGRLARLHGDAVKQHLAFRRDRIANQIALADRAAARKHDDVVVDEIVERCEQRVERVGRGRVHDRNAAVV